MQPDPEAWPEYISALTHVLKNLADQLARTDPKLLPVRLYIAGGAALHLHSGGRLSEDIDGMFSRRVALDDSDLKVAYKDRDGRARFLYLDRNYNDTLGLMHEDAYGESLKLDLPGIDARILEVRILTPLDLAVSKLARYGERDREDIALLAGKSLISADTLRERATQALENCVGNTESVATSIDLACNLVASIQRKSASAPRGKGRSGK